MSIKINVNILEATEFRGIVPKGGSTKPWLVEATNAEGNTELYVVKMFTPKQLRQQNAGLAHFDPFVLEDVATTLIEHAQSVGNIELLTDYFLTIQKDPTRFGELLQQQLS